MVELPRGTVTLLFTDIEGSTQLLRRLGRERYAHALGEHRRLLRDAFTRHGGVEVEMQGDSFHFAFSYARDAVAAAAEGQRALSAHEWPDEPIRVRMGVHTGEPTVQDNLYAGLDVHRAARVMSAAHGGQILLSGRSRDIVEGELSDGLSLDDLGSWQLKDIERPEALAQVRAAGLDERFLPPRAVPAPASLSQLSARPRTLVVGLALASIAGAIALVAAFVLRGGHSASVTLTPNSVAEIDSAVPRILADHDVGTDPGALVAADGAVWVANTPDSTISRVDVATGESRTIGVPVIVASLTALGHYLWLGAANENRIVRLDMAFPQTVISIGVARRCPTAAQRAAGGVDLPCQGRAGVSGLAAGAGSVWAIGELDGWLYKLSESGSIVAWIPLIPNQIGCVACTVAADARAVWVAMPAYHFDQKASLLQIDPSGNRIEGRVPLPASPAGISVVGDAVWVALPEAQRVERINSSLSVERIFDVPGSPQAVAATPDAVWVGTTDHVYRLDPQSGRVTWRSPSLAASAVAITLQRRRVWVALQTR